MKSPAQLQAEAELAYEDFQIEVAARKAELISKRKGFWSRLMRNFKTKKLVIKWEKR